MAKQAKARVDAKGLTGLGVEKLVEILLDEASANKALKARLETALAGAAGPDEIARVVDKRLDAIEQAKTAINRARARDFTTELAGLLRNIRSELATADAGAAFERLIRFVGLRSNVEKRLKVDNARLMAVFAEAETAAIELMPDISESEQAAAVPTLETTRKRDRYGERIEFYTTLIMGLAPKAARAWQDLLDTQMKSADAGPVVPRLLQRLALSQGDVDRYIAIEQGRPENRRDTYAVALMLQGQGRFADALDWARRPVPATRILEVNGTITGVGEDYQSRDRKLLEADLLDALKRRDDAQAIRWAAFLDTFDADILRRYIARLDDFAEFDELDRAFAAVRASPHIVEALAFLIEWPKLDQAAGHVLAHTGRWESADADLLASAADMLAESQPLAATVLYRALIRQVLERGISDAYGEAVQHLRRLAALSLSLPEGSPFSDHAAFLSGLMNKYPRRLGFWQRLSG